MDHGCYALVISMEGKEPISWNTDVCYSNVWWLGINER